MAAKEESALLSRAVLAGDCLECVCECPGGVGGVGGVGVDQGVEQPWDSNIYSLDGKLFARYPGTAFYVKQDGKHMARKMVNMKPCVRKVPIPKVGDMCKFKVTVVQCNSVFGTIVELNGQRIPHEIPATVKRRDATDLEEKRVFLQELFAPGEEYEGVLVSLNDGVKLLVSTALHFRQMLMSPK